MFPFCAHKLMTLQHTHLHQAVQQGRLPALQNGMPRVYLHSVWKQPQLTRCVEHGFCPCPKCQIYHTLFSL